MKNNVFIFVVLLPVLTCQAQIITVDDDLPADFNNIQAAIDDSNDADTVIVAPGTYTGPGNRDIDFKAKAITVRSIDPNDPNIVAATIINRQHRGRGFRFCSGEGPDSIIEGLTIIDGYHMIQIYGPIEAILCKNSSPTIRKNVIRNNRGHGIVCTNSSPIITHNIIRENVDRHGAGIYCDGGSPIITNNLITRNIVEQVEPPVISIGEQIFKGAGIDCRGGSP